MASETKEENQKSWADIEDEELNKKLANTEIPKQETKEEDDPSRTLEKSLVKDGIALNRGSSLVVQQDDPNSPLHSVKSFEELNLSKELLEGIYAMGFNKPSKIQEVALPVILANPPKNMIAQAQSGTGKTAAFTLGMLSRVDVKVKAPQAICLCNTRELSRQLLDCIERMGKFTGIKVHLAVKEGASGKVDSQIIVGTPGKVLDLIKKRSFDTKLIKIFVLDEADVMVDTQAGLGEQSVKVKKSLPPKVQTLLFSATYKPNVREFATRVVPQPCFQIKLKKTQLTIDAIKQLYIDCKTEDNKFKVLSDIYGFLNVGQSIIFVQKRQTASELAKRMTSEGHTVSFLHGGEDMSVQDRDRVIDDFRNAKTKVLITTNVLARGIDILQVMMVINYDIPLDTKNKPDTETYLHRIGRSGRFGRHGIAINFVHDRESLNQVKYLESFFQRPITEFPAEKIEDLEQMLQQIKEEDQKLNERLARGEFPADDGHKD